MKTIVAVAPEPKPSQHEDFLAFMELILPQLSDEAFFDLYHQRKRKENWRRGQFFFNTLPDEYQEILRGSLADPFHKDDWDSVYKALDYLLDRI